jgi:hypothetical protein
MFVQQGVAKALLGKSKKPRTMSEKEWEDIYVGSLNAIHLCLANDVLFNIVAEKKTTGLWKKLESLYMTKSLMNKIFLKRHLYSLRMKEGKEIDDRLNTLNILLCQLTSMGVKFKTKYKEITLLCSFPETWDHFCTSMSFISSEAIEFDDIMGALLSEEKRKKSNLETSTSEAMVTRGRSKERGKNQRGTSQSKSK